MSSLMIVDHQRAVVVFVHWLAPHINVTAQSMDHWCNSLKVCLFLSNLSCKSWNGWFKICNSFWFELPLGIRCAHASHRAHGWHHKHWFQSRIYVSIAITIDPSSSFSSNWIHWIVGTRETNARNSNDKTSKTKSLNRLWTTSRKSTKVSKLIHLNVIDCECTNKRAFYHRKITTIA